MKCQHKRIKKEIWLGLTGDGKQRFTMIRCLDCHNFVDDKKKNRRIK